MRQHKGLRDRIAAQARPISAATAVLFVLSAVLLALDAKLPFPPPSERMLYEPGGLGLLVHRSAAAGEGPAGRQTAAAPPQARAGGARGAWGAKSAWGVEGAGGPPVGGYSYSPPPLTMMLYRARPGDTISGIAQKLGLDPDTVSSLNRVEGRGVHNITVGEDIRVPNQDGIFMAVSGNLDALCDKYRISAEEVLGANRLTRESLAPGSRLFFPGVQHTGYEYSLSTGVAVLNPLRAGWQSSSFGYREDPFSGERRKHRGVDIAANAGSPVKSASDGVVRVAGWDDVLGNYVEVRSRMGYSYIYGHMSRLSVRAGTVVAQGQVLGAVGSTGRATGPHLHFEVRKNGVPQNPRLFISGLR
jgi:murein DD-endopeptidase MepM/ murein hydrolase activator NlpD